MNMVKASRETKSFAVGLSMTVAGRVFAETVMLILMFWVPSEEALCGITLNAKPIVSVSTGLELQHVLSFSNATCF
jgi:hypothetical protein